MGIFLSEAVNEVEGRRHWRVGVSILMASSMWTVNSPKHAVRTGWTEKRCQNCNEGSQSRTAAGKGNNRIG